MSELDVNGDVNISGTLNNKTKTLSNLTNGTTLMNIQSGSTILQSIDNSTINLPETSAGLTFTFIWTGSAGDGFNIAPHSNDKIMGSIIDHSNNINTADGVDDDGKMLQLGLSSKIGDRVKLLADGSDGWFIIEGLGDWSFES